MINKQLQELKKQGICDPQTVKRLSIDDPFIQERIAMVLERYNTSTEETVDSLGRKLLFLETLLESPEEQRKKVLQWLQEDDKRTFLFDYSPQGALYGNLLLAKAEDRLEEFRRKFNPQAEPQKSFVFEKKLALENIVDEGAKELIDKKKNALCEAVRHREFGKVYEALVHCLEITYLRELEKKGSGKKNNRLLDYFVLAGDVGVHTEDYGEESLREFYYRADKSFGQMPHADLEEKAKKVKEKVLGLLRKYEEREINPLIESLEKAAVDEINLSQNLMEKLNLSHKDLAEIKALNKEYSLLNERAKLSEKSKKANRFTYTLRLADKDPLDVRIGNDSGSCIGISPESKEIGNAYGLPAMMADNATYIVEVMQQRNQGKERRTGIALMFDTRSEKGQKILTGNSLELSGAMNPIEIVKSLVPFCEEGITAFGRENGFAAGIMSNHDYNTSQNHSTKTGEKFHGELLKKPRKKNEPAMYSEVLDDEGKVEGKLYILYDDRKK